MNGQLNMGIYDITNGIVIDIKSYGCENKNKEIKCASEYVKNNLHLFKDRILIADRGYHS